MAEKTTRTYRVMLAQARSAERVRLVEALREQRQFFAVDVVGDGLECLDMVRALKPDLVIVDAALSGLDGLGVLGQLNTEEFSHVRRMMLSHYGGFVQVQALQMGADLFVMTPANHARVAQLALQLVEAARQAAEPTEDDILQETRRILLELLPPSQATRIGLTDISNGVLLLIQGKHSVRYVTDDLYPAIGACRKAHWQTVERSIRVLVNDIWKCAPLRNLEQDFPRYFQEKPSAPKKPTSASFLLDLTELVSSNLHCHWSNRRSQNPRQQAN